MSPTAPITGSRTIGRPGEFLHRGGDCEDYALAKYLALRALGFAAADLRIVALSDAARGLHHAVLTVRLEGRWMMTSSFMVRVS